MLINARQRIPPRTQISLLHSTQDRKVRGESRAQSGSRCIDSCALGEVSPGVDAAAIALRRAPPSQVPACGGSLDRGHAHSERVLPARWESTRDLTSTHHWSDENTASDNEKWLSFLEAVIARYKADPNMTIDASGNIKFTQGEHPTLQRKGYLFRRFSSTVTGRLAGNAYEYLREVEIIAAQYFGDRVVPWDEHRDESAYGPYGWDEVYAAAEL
ncbi:hypothetical protein DFH09DRAFT_1316463 [Mycena vulgaris]|nr:hypothetical protein DFH09DRAFT_1316463 [Mycena vulgaris]